MWKLRAYNTNNVHNIINLRFKSYRTKIKSLCKIKTSVKVITAFRVDKTQSLTAVICIYIVKLDCSPKTLFHVY